MDAVRNGCSLTHPGALNFQTFQRDVTPSWPTRQATPRCATARGAAPEVHQLVDLTEGGIEDVEIRLSKGAVIAGRVINDLGEPVVGARVVVYAIRFDGTERKLEAVQRGPADSDDLGAFRVGGLSAGSYLLSVVALAAPPAGTTVTDGRYADLTGPTRRIGLGRTFYPSSATSAGAVPIELGPGEERLDVDVALTPYRPATLSIGLSSNPNPALNGATTPAEARRLAVDPAVVRSVPQLSVALAAGDNPDVESRGTGVIGFSGLDPNPQPMTVAIDPGNWVAIARRGIDGAIAHLTLGPGEGQSAALAVRPASLFSGHVVFAGSSRHPSPSAVGLELLGAGPDAGVSPQLLAPGAPFVVKPDGSFSIAGVLGSVELVVSAPAGWAVSQMTGADRDLLGTATTFEGGEVISDARVVLTDQIAEISGSVVDRDARPASGCTIAIFPSDPRGAFSRYRMQLAQADRTGRFVLRELPAGSYTVAATSDDMTNWTASGNLDRLRALGTSVTLAEREKTSLTLACGGSR